jgi:hypothetical protein
MANGEVRPPAVRPQGPAQSSAGGFGIWARSHVPFLIVALLVVGIGGYLWYKHEKNKTTAATTTGTDLLTATESGDLDTISSNTTAEVQAINQLYGALVSTTPVAPSTTVPVAPSSPVSPTSPNPPTTNTGPPPPPGVGTPPGTATPPAPVTSISTQPGYFDAATAAKTQTLGTGTSGPATGQAGVSPTVNQTTGGRVTPPTKSVVTAATKLAGNENLKSTGVTKPTKAAPKQTYTNAQELTAL